MPRYKQTRPRYIPTQVEIPKDVEIMVKPYMKEFIVRVMRKAHEIARRVGRDAINGDDVRMAVSSIYGEFTEDSLSA